MANEFTFTSTEGLSGLGVSIGGKAGTLLADGGVPIKKTIPAGSTNYEFDVPTITVANCKALGIDCSVPCTVKVNDATSPDDTLTMDAAAGTDHHIWRAVPAGQTNFITATTITKFFVTIPGAVAGLFQFVAAVDTTPVGTP